MQALASREPKVTLPKAWPRVARSAIVHAVALAHFAVTHVRGWCADSPLQRVRLAAECERLGSEVALLREELRIKDARLARIPAQHRPHYPPVVRLAILALKASRGWTLAQAAARLLVVPATVASWLERGDEDGPGALIRTATPVNRLPEFVREIIGRVKAAFPAIGSLRIANMLARAGLHLARTTVRRLLRTRAKHSARPPRRLPGSLLSGRTAHSAQRTAPFQRCLSRSRRCSVGRSVGGWR